MEFIDIMKETEPYQEMVWELYEEAFPPQEKKPRELMERMAQEGRMELLAAVENGTFIGLVMNMLNGKTALLDYFAIAPEHRSRGFGGKIIRELLGKFKDQRYIFEIEMQDENASNAEERKRRKAFYLRNGLKETGVFANVYETDFELLTPDGDLTYQQYLDMLVAMMGEKVESHLKPVLIKEECRK